MNMKDKTKKTTVSRRDFIKKSGIAAAGLTILPSSVVSGLGHTAPSDKLNIAAVGVGGIGANNLKNLTGQNIVALCDVDWNYAAGTFKKYAQAKQYKDYRVMLEKQKDIDAVIVATSDHTHAHIAGAAMKMGKHVYVQKPLTHSVSESRYLTKLAEETGVATQMGNQGNSGEGIRQVCEWIWDGAIGEVKEVHTWTNRPIWPQGLERPTETHDIPDTLAWDLFLGPAPDRPYNPIYTPWNFRGWWDFGTGALGDMGCHIIDVPFKALKLGYPEKVLASSTMVNTESPPQAETVHLKFPAREGMPAVDLKWFDGGIMPPVPEDIPVGDFPVKERFLGDGSGGCIFYGSKGYLVCGTYGKNPMLFPKELDEQYRENPPEKTLRRVKNYEDAGNHEMDWVRACKEDKDNRTEASAYFGYSGPMNETVVMGNLAVRLQDLKKWLEWDGENMKFSNISPNEEVRVVKSDKFEVINGHPHFDTQYETINALEASQQYVKREYRKGWELP